MRLSEDLIDPENLIFASASQRKRIVFCNREVLRPDERPFGKGLLMFSERLDAAISGARTLARLDRLSRLIWQGHGAGAINDADAHSPLVLMSLPLGY